MRTVRYTAGLMIATGACLAFAGPASAAPQPDWNPYAASSPSQGLLQDAVNVQVVLNNVGNPQIGWGNTNYGGSAAAYNNTTQYAPQRAGGLFGF